LIGLLGRSGQIFFLKNQNDVVLVKKEKQKSTGCNRIFDQVLPSRRVNLPGQPGHTRFFSSPVFSSIWPSFSSGFYS
jgi:hypothetical protein